MAGKRIGVMVLLLGLPTARADAPAPAKVDNPVFTAWSKADVGTTTVLEADEDGPDGKKMHVTETDKLKEKTADGVKIESVSQEGDHKEPAKTVSFPAKIAAADLKLIREENIAVGDVAYKCKVYDVAGTAVGDTADSKYTIFVCDDAPGGIVREVFHAKNGKDFASQLAPAKGK
jgi:hypothetical protein